jgi:hypothetical protein
VTLIGGDLDESPMAYRRLPKVLAHHSGAVKGTAHVATVRGRNGGSRRIRSVQAYVRSMWVTAERVREENSSEGDDMASITRRSRDIPGTYAQPNISRSVADRSCQIARSAFRERRGFFVGCARYFPNSDLGAIVKMAAGQ